MDSELKYTVVTSGDKDWILDVAVPLAEGLETAAQDTGNLVLERKLPELLNCDSQPKASATLLIGGVVGIILFVTTRIGIKIIDDIYELKIQPIVRKSLSPVDAKLKGGNFKKKKALMLGIYYEDLDILVLVAIVGDSFKEIIELKAVAKHAHSSTLEWMRDSGLKNKVLLRTVQPNGGDEAVLIFDNMQSAQDHIQSLEILEQET